MALEGLMWFAGGLTFGHLTAASSTLVLPKSLWKRAVGGVVGLSGMTRFYISR